MDLANKIESLLFIAGKPLGVKKINELTGATAEEAAAALSVLKEKYNQSESGLRLVNDGKDWQLMTNPNNSQLVKDYLQDEISGEMTRPSLETLTIIAYRGPLTKLELEQIRGVNCSLILRNLLIRGLIQVEEDKNHALPVYRVTMDFLRFLGINEVSEMPDYDKLHNHDLLQKLLEDAEIAENA